MGKRILVTSTDLMMIQFLVPHVRYLSENGFDVEVACSDVGGRMDEVRTALDGAAKAIHTVRLHRSPAAAENLKGYGDMKRVIASGNYDIIWANEPVMGVVTRLAARKARKKGTRVVYMAHGFHFFKGAPKKNWLVCPIELLMSRFCDTLVTINWEDYRWAKQWLKTPKIEHIDGIGVDFTARACAVPRDAKRKELGVHGDDILVLSVGELQQRKNHEVIIRAIALLNNPHIKYFICGRGELLDYLTKLANSLQLQNQVFFLGYRKDIPEIMNASDIYAHPSRREGLGLASLEAMASGLPLVTSNVQGIPDYVENGITGFMCAPMDIPQYAKHLDILISDPELRSKIGQTNLQRVKKYAVSQIQPAIAAIMNPTTA